MNDGEIIGGRLYFVGHGYVMFLGALHSNRYFRYFPVSPKLFESYVHEVINPHIKHAYAHAQARTQASTHSEVSTNWQHKL